MWCVLAKTWYKLKYTFWQHWCVTIMPILPRPSHLTSLVYKDRAEILERSMDRVSGVHPVHHNRLLGETLASSNFTKKIKLIFENSKFHKLMQFFLIEQDYVSAQDHMTLNYWETK